MNSTELCTLLSQRQEKEHSKMRAHLAKFGCPPMAFPIQPLRCVDGFEISVQASSDRYCIPKKAFAEFYEQVEVGFPSEIEPVLLPYSNEISVDPTECIYGYVPTEIVAEIITRHGGIKEGTKS